MLRAFGFFILFILLAVPVCGIAGWWYTQRSLPVLDGVVTLKQLSHPAVVRFDERAVPYIEASNDLDAYFVQGYVTAAERMFQMDVMRRTSEGRMADLFGSTFMPQDKLMRTLGFQRLAEAEYKRLPNDLKEGVNAYCKGVNAYLDGAQGRQPLEFVLMGMQIRKWSPADTLSILKYQQYELDESWRLDDLRQRIVDKVGDKLASIIFEQPLKQSKPTDAGGEQPVQTAPRSSDQGKKTPATANNTNFAPDSLAPHRMSELVAQSLKRLKRLPVMAPLPLWGSNAWAVSSSMSDSKGCLLACDSHGQFQSPDRYYLCSLVTPNMHVAGATIPGVPGIVIGRNAYFGWGATALKADTQDLVLEQLSPQFPGKYKCMEGWQNMEEVPEYISVRFHANAYQEKVLVTKHGPVLLKDNNTAVSLNWTGFDEKPSVLETIVKINHGKNWQDFLTALEKYSGASATFLYADQKGNVGFHVAGNIPVRTTSGITMTPGWNGDAEWKGRIKFSELPSGFNPAQGFIVADNPEFVQMNFTNNPLRALRIGATLSAYKRSQQKLGLPDMAVLQGDENAALAALVKKEMDKAAAKAELVDRDQLTALEGLRNWDGLLRPNSQSATVYEAFVVSLARRVLEPRLGTQMADEYFERWPRWTLIVQKLLADKPKDLLPKEERSFETFMLTTFSQALKNIRVATEKQEGPVTCPWESLHKIKFRHLIDQDNVEAPMLGFLYNIAPVGVGGDQDCVNACNVDVSAQPEVFSCSSGPIQRLLIDLADNDKFYQTVALGQSGHLSSANRTDQLNAWLKNEPHAVAFSSKQTDSQMQHKLILTNQ